MCDVRYISIKSHFLIMRSKRFVFCSGSPNESMATLTFLPGTRKYGSKLTQSGRTYSLYND